jgi:alkanesulfonate monooxygenase SsuD/methylene tetrahydromethanopterin reductase-like flavin-dependent oxidoreductase (luciferase family)
MAAADPAALRAGARRGALLIGDPQEVIDKILYEHELFRMNRFLMQFSVGSMPHAKMLRAIELFGTKWLRRSSRHWRPR